MNKPDKKLLLRAKNLVPLTTTEEQMYSLCVILDMYIKNPTIPYKNVLETYCDLLEICLDLDKLEEQNKHTLT